MPADESSAASGTDRSRAGAAISRALTPPLLAGPLPAGPAPFAGLALRSRPATGSRRPPRRAEAGERALRPGLAAGPGCGRPTSGHDGPGTAL